jgi:hypothetical protein
LREAVVSFEPPRSPLGVRLSDRDRCIADRTTSAGGDVVAASGDPLGSRRADGDGSL